MSGNSKEELRVHEILKNLMAGKNILTSPDIVAINKIGTDFLNGNLYMDDLETIREILLISNILYNNTDMEILPLEDGQYDLIVTKYNKLTHNQAPIGAPSTYGLDKKLTTKDLRNLEPAKNQMIRDGMFDIPEDKRVYLKNIKFNTYPQIPEDYMIDTSDTRVMTKLIRDTKPSYPELIGTLHKCKFVTLADAHSYGITDDDMNVMTFDRDFLSPTFPYAEDSSRQAGRNYVELITELKYDGVSIEAEIIGDTIVSANSRGDTENQQAADYTPIFGGKVFKRATNHVDPNLKFGMKFEAIITYDNLLKIAQMFGIEYKNPRVAVSGILSNSDAATLRDFITLVPIKTAGLKFNSVMEEINWVNRYYSSGIEMRYAIMRGDYYQLVEQVKQFCDEAEYMRSSMNFAYDGIVVSYTDPVVQKILGRNNSIDGWSIAIKFNAQSKNTYFVKCEYSVGQDGRITPIGYFTPVEFFGTSHDKTTLHSYKRFNELGLRCGSIVNIRYTNDVICYLTKPDISYNRRLDAEQPPLEFPTVCPCCKKELTFSESGDSAWCMNPFCEEKVLARVHNMVKKLGIKDFGKAQIKKLAIKGLRDLLDRKDKDILAILGEANGYKLIEALEKLVKDPIEDYKLIGALGFTGVSQSRWERILKRIRLDRVVKATQKDLFDMIYNISGMGRAMAEIIVHERDTIFLDDLYTILAMKNVISSYEDGYVSIRPEVRFSGIRDPKLMDEFISHGFDADGDKGVTKNTAILIVPYDGFVSSKVNRISRLLAEGKTQCVIMTPSIAYQYLLNLSGN